MCSDVYLENFFHNLSEIGIQRQKRSSASLDEELASLFLMPTHAVRKMLKHFDTRHGP